MRSSNSGCGWKGGGGGGEGDFDLLTFRVIKGQIFSMRSSYSETSSEYLGINWGYLTTFSSQQFLYSTSLRVETNQCKV